MSTQVLNDVQLPTVQEVQAMINGSVVTEDTIDSKISTAKTALETQIKSETSLREAGDTEIKALLQAETVARTTAENNIDDRIRDEAELRETTDDSLQAQITRELGVREAADDEIIKLIKAETAERKETTEQCNKNTADIAALKVTESAVFEDTLFCARFSNLPLAQITIENLDTEVAVGDILGSVSARYIPATPITTSFVTKVTDGYAYISVRLDANGNVIVINVTKLAETFAGNVNSETVMYLTKE